MSDTKDYYEGKDSVGDARILNHIVNNGVDVNVQNQVSEPVNYYMCNQTGITNLTTESAIGDSTITVDDVTGAVVGYCVNIRDSNRFYQGLIKSIVGNVITVTPEIDFNVTIIGTVCFGAFNMAVNGSVTNQIFRMKPPVGVKWDIQTMTYSIVDDAVMDDTKFGGIAPLPNGILLKSVNGITKNLWLVNNNAGFKQRGFSKEYNDKSGGGLYGVDGIKNINTINGVALRFDGDTDDELELIVRDDLSGLSEFTIVCIGHVVKD